MKVVNSRSNLSNLKRPANFKSNGEKLTLKMFT